MLEQVLQQLIDIMPIIGKKRCAELVCTVEHQWLFCFNLGKANSKYARQNIFDIDVDIDTEDCATNPECFHIIVTSALASKMFNRNRDKLTLTID